MSAPPTPGLEVEEDVEVWDGVPVVKGSPSASHEAVRAALISQLDAQRPPGMSVVVSSIAGDEHEFARSDGSVIDIASGLTPVWVEVLSESDLRRGDARLVGRRRRRWLFAHGVLSLWAVTDVFGTISLTVLHADGTVLSHASPQTAVVPDRLPQGELSLEVDLARVGGRRPRRRCRVAAATPRPPATRRLQ
jgi:hypothetical protein